MIIKFSSFFAVVLIASVTFSQTSDTKTPIYENAWKLVEIAGDNASYYTGMMDGCLFFIAEDGIVGRYCKETNELYTTCCWERRGKKKFIFSDSAELEKCKIIVWTETEISLEPVREKGTILHFKK